MTRYSDGYLSPVPPPLPPDYIENLDKGIEDVLKRRPKLIQQSLASTAQNSQLTLPETSSPPFSLSEILSSSSQLPCAEPELLGDNHEGEVNSLEALANEETKKLGGMEPARTRLMLKPLLL